MIAFYGRTLKVVLRYQTVTLLMALATLVLTVVIYIEIPKGFFPVQDTGVIQGISQASQSISFDAMARSSSAGADHPSRSRGGKPLFVYRRRRHQHHAQQRPHLHQPEASRTARHQCFRCDPPTAAQPATGTGNQLYMQPVQDITVDDRVSRTQYQYTLEDPDSDELNAWTDKFVAQMKKLPEIEDVATDQQTGAARCQLDIDRVTASRLGIAPTTIDNTLYDAYGQRQINTLYTQLNQYHVMLETAPEWQLNPDKLGDLYIQSNASSGATGAGAATSFSSSASASAGSNARPRRCDTRLLRRLSALPPERWAAPSGPRHHQLTAAGANAVPLAAFTQVSDTTEALSVNHQGQFPAVTVSFNLAPNASLGNCDQRHRKVAARIFTSRPVCSPISRAPRHPSTIRSPTKRC